MSLRLPESVRSVVVIRADNSGRMVSTTLHEKETRKKKGTRKLRPVERAITRAAEGAQEFANSYLSRHDKSNEKKKNGWARDFAYNVYKADRAGMKKLKLMDNVVRVFM
jgi:Family of unknown function (DUF6312)